MVELRFSRGLLSLCSGALLCVATACGSDSDSTGNSDDPAASNAGSGGAMTGIDGDPVSGDPTRTPVTGSPVPCDVQEVVANHCHQCHGEVPAGGAIRLMTHEDWHQTSPLYDKSKKVYEVAQIRIDNGEMPQGSASALTDGDRAVLDAWLGDGATVGGPDDAECGVTIGADDGCDREGALEPLVARPGETCYEFPVHGVTGVDDTSKFTVPTGESYHEWYYEVPWAPTDQMTRFGAKFDNLEVLHHYLIFTSSAQGKVPGQVDENVLGTTLGTNATLVGGWAVGGCNVDLPEDVGGVLPESSLLMVQWHMFNATGSEQTDGSVVQICTVPEGSREHTAGVTFLGTENLGGFFGMPPGPNEFTTECTNNSGAPVTVLSFTPHMHLIGTNMKTEVRRLDGKVETIFDEPFQFDYQVGYRLEPRVVVEPGETLITTCSFFNDTGANVAFGEGTNEEMCYQYIGYYPAGALDNGVFSLIGALNTCW